jgi:Domain of unknown function (DUF6473)
MREGIGRCGELFARCIVGEVDAPGGRAQLPAPLGEEVLIAVAAAAGSHGVGRIVVAAEVVALREFRQRIEFRGRFVAEVVVQRAEPAFTVIARRGLLPRGLVPGGVEVDRGARFRLFARQRAEVVREAALRLRRPPVCGVEMGGICRGVEQKMAGTAVAVTVPQVMVVAVHRAFGRQAGFGEVGVAGPVEELVEQPVRGAAVKALAAIGVEARGRASGAHRLGDPGIAAQVPGLVEVDVGRVAGALAELEIEAQDGGGVLRVHFLPHGRVGGEIPVRIKDRPGDRDRIRQSQHIIKEETACQHSIFAFKLYSTLQGGLYIMRFAAHQRRCVLNCGLKSQRSLAMHYQDYDSNIIDYKLVRLPETELLIRGPLPTNFLTGGYVAGIGAAQTFGRFAERPFLTLLSEKLGVPVLNLGFAGAGPKAFLDRSPLINACNQASLAIVQVMSGRSVSNSYFENTGADLLRPWHARDEEPVHSEVAYQKLIDHHDRGFIEQILNETRETYVKEMAALMTAITVPKILFWFSQRTPDYTPRFGSAGALFGHFPQFVTGGMVKELKTLAATYVECVTSRGLPQPLHNKITGEPVRLDLGVRYPWHNNYYPSPEMHIDAAKALLDAVQQQTRPESNSHP